MEEDDNDKRLLLLFPVVIFLITAVGGSMALNTPINVINNSSDLNFEYNTIFLYSFKTIDIETDNQSAAIKYNGLETFKDKNLLKNNDSNSEVVYAAPENTSENNVTVQSKDQLNDSAATRWNLNGTKTVYLTSDNIVDKNTDTKFLKRLAFNLESNGINVIIDPDAPNPSQVPRSIKNAPKDSAVVVINYNCAGTIKDLTVGISGPQTNGKTDKGYLYEYAKDLRGIIYVNVSPDTILTNCSYLPRAYDDGFSPKSFKGLKKPAEHLSDSGIYLIDNIEPLYPIMSIKRADVVSNKILALLKQ